MQVFKFGGASVNSVERIQRVGKIIEDHSDKPLVIIISAMGKTTNALEKVAEAFFAGETEKALELFQAIKQHHLTLAKYLLVTRFNDCLKALTDFFTETEWLLHDKPVRGYDYYYDQIVCCGELISTSIVSHYLEEAGIPNRWLDVRDLIRTDDTFRDATINWAVSADRISFAVKSLQNGSDRRPVITQGFIGATDENESTTLGREGSDYTAAVFANVLNADNLTIWKDVAAVMNADPKQFPDAQLLPELNFTEVIEMAYYGAQVIHPKTIKPLQNKAIPLFVKCFLDPDLPGTAIRIQSIKGLPPIIVIKQNQALLHLKSRDFSFVGEAPMGELYHLFEKLHIRPNLIQTGAINVQLCLDDRPDVMDKLAFEADSLFDIQVEKDLSLLTVRHYQENILERLIQGKQIVLSQRTPEVIQVLYREEQRL